MIGVHALFLYTAVGFDFRPEGVSAGSVALSALILVAVLSLGIAALLSLHSRETPPVSSDRRQLWGFLLLWLAFVVLRGVSADHRQVLTLVISPDLAPAWILPCVMLLGARPQTWAALRPVMVLHTYAAVSLGSAGLVMGAFDPGWRALLNHGLFWAAPLLFLSSVGRHRRYFLLGLSGLLLTLAKALIIGVRGLAVITVFYLLGAFYVLLRHPEQQRRRGSALLLLMAAAMLVVFFGSRFVSGEMNVYVEQAAFLAQKGVSSGRLDLTREFFAEISTATMLVGDGVNGEYWSEHFGFYRSNIEIGVLQMILKGGIVLVGLFVFTAVVPGVRRLFRGVHTFQLACALVVTGRVAFMLGGATPWFGLSDLLFWLCVGNCSVVPFHRVVGQTR